MLTKALPIAGFPHLSLAALDDPQLRRRFLDALRASGFIIETTRVVPPDGADPRAVIGAITVAFQNANRLVP